MDGVIVVDKPSGWTSHDVVNKMRRIAGTRRVGHLGTLDPVATGVLPLVIGKATRLSQFFVKSDKRYEAVVYFGYATDTYDCEGTPLGEDQPCQLDPGQVETWLRRFQGVFEQVPPPVSAKKVGGRRAYELARRNIEVRLDPVEVHVYSIDTVEIGGNTLRLRVHCSAGTYLRAIAHELGQMAGCGAHLKSLVRLASGAFTIEQARTLPQLEALAAAGELHTALVSGADLLPEFPAERVDTITANQIRQGRDFRVSPFRASRGAKFVKALTQDGELIAIGEARLANLYHPVLVL